MHSYVLMLFQSNTSEAGNLSVFVFLVMFMYVLSSICLVNFTGFLESSLDHSWGFGNCGYGVLFLPFDSFLLS